MPVLDFIALDEKESTMEAILQFFKRKNEGWAQIETFVIDKDFKEWRVLERCFPDATVLLCQFHTMANWKKVVKRAKYDLTGIQQDEVEFSIKQMMYSTTTAAYNRLRDGFEGLQGRVSGYLQQALSRDFPVFTGKLGVV